MHKSFKPNDFLPAAIQNDGRDAASALEVRRNGNVEPGNSMQPVWQAPWSSVGEAEPGWWQAFELSKDVRATRTPDRFIKKQSDTNVVTLSTDEATELARAAREESQAGRRRSVIVLKDFGQQSKQGYPMLLMLR